MGLSGAEVGRRRPARRDRGRSGRAGARAHRPGGELRTAMVVSACPRPARARSCAAPCATSPTARAITGPTIATRRSPRPRRPRARSRQAEQGRGPHRRGDPEATRPRLLRRSRFRPCRNFGLRPPRGRLRARGWRAHRGLELLERAQAQRHRMARLDVGARSNGCGRAPRGWSAWWCRRASRSGRRSVRDGS